MSALRHRFVKRLAALSVVAAMVLSTSALSAGCYTQRFDVGAGAAGGETRQFTQWFALWGLVPITQVEDDVESFTAGATDYTVTTQFTPLDILIGFFTNIVTIGPKTVTVER